MELPQVELALAELRGLVSTNSKFKARSQETHCSIHVAYLSSLPADTNIDVVLIGDSMIERFKTTDPSTSIATLSSSFNAGVGGDKIENVLYRLDIGLLDLLRERNVKIWVLAVGTNNLGNKGLKTVDVEKYEVLLKALLSLSSGSRVLACELFRRDDVSDEVVGKSNEMLKMMVKNLNEEVGAERVSWSDAPPEITKDVREDHVHLNEKGYGIWSGTLYLSVQELLKNNALD